MFCVPVETNGIVQIYDVYCQRIRKGHTESNYRVWLVRGKDKIYLGEVLEASGGYGVPNWWAYGDPDKVTSAEGFGRRQWAIEYMLIQHGYWKPRGAFP